MPQSPISRFGDGQPGERQYALVEGDQILSISEYRSTAPGDPSPGRRVLPVEYADSMPFDPDLHYRLDPVARVDGDRVVRVYPVILKSEDRA
ncbi:hypothetical protein SAMN05216330_104453 [Bradyrhizobium sp. Ghvi]|uniref:hypothetical protein n=1 Tax=Bradyrhizobium sp. Ghvi TaxID=1855319 RepID=UPI0008E29977|nr:hypothetical protein [Bradyrhizobium sp. Ghvi]SFO74263.1 hypothetical protein SAMN05216330_104453 [Bradyrhizobium sp. Ghvi]